MRMLLRALCPLSLLAAATAAQAEEWRLDHGVAIVSPVENNSTMELLVVSCGDPYFVEVYARGGPVLPDPGGEGVEAGYFYTPGKVQARIDGQVFAMTAAGSDAAVVLFGEGAADHGYMAPVPLALIAALRAGTMLMLAFDITDAASAVDGTPHETFARFPLAGSAAALDAALASCS